MNRQRGVTLSGLMIGVVIIIVLALAAMKVLPSIMEYQKILKVTKTVAQDPAMKSATVAGVRNAFDKYQAIEDFTKVAAADLDVTKDGDELVLSFAYQDKIPLFKNVSLVIDYEGTSSK